MSMTSVAQSKNNPAPPLEPGPVPLVRLRGVTKTFRRGSEKVEVLKHLDLDVPRGDFLALMGPSGSGKTTLLNILGGIDRPTSGEVLIDGEPLQRMSEGALTRWRARHIGFVFQLYHLLPVLTAEENVALPLILTRLSAAERKRRACAALALVGLEDRARHKPGELSGGQEQRVGIARAIVTDPTILLCDEPTGDLDRKAGDEILHLLHLLNNEHGKTIIMVTHDPRAAARAQHTLFMDKGVLSEEPESLT
ncbi:MAG TPA: ABC transporter ATP-binding protein [Rhizomicrobium sp.]|jgi:putative ABC transport system ATP-binding protein